MRIISVRVTTVARILAILYAAIGFGAWLQYVFGRAQQLTIPFGIVVPFFHLNFNLHLMRSNDVAYNLLLCVASLLLYSATGWVTGFLGTLFFNLIAARVGGIEVKHFSLSEPAHQGRQVENVATSEHLEARS